MANNGRELVSRPQKKLDKYDRDAMKWYTIQMRAMQRQQRQEQQWSARQALLDRQFQADQAQNQMNFQQQMSDTAHQREVADLQAAGLNPVLSAGGSGASSPAGASASGAQANFVSSIVDSMPSLFNTVMSMAETQRQQAEAMKQAQKTSARVYYRSVKKEEEPKVPETKTADDMLQKAEEQVAKGEAVFKTKNFNNPVVYKKEQDEALDQINGALENVKLYLRASGGMTSYGVKPGVSVSVGVKDIKQVVLGCAKIYGMTQVGHQQKLRADRLRSGKGNMFERAFEVAYRHPSLENIQKMQDAIYR